MKSVVFYYGLGSRYSYLAFSQLERIESVHGVQFVLRPISSIELFDLRGRSPLPVPHFLVSTNQGTDNWMPKLGQQCMEFHL